MSIRTTRQIAHGRPVASDDYKLIRNAYQRHVTVGLTEADIRKLAQALGKTPERTDYILSIPTRERYELAN